MYVKGVSEKISKIIRELNPTIQLCFRNHRNANPFFTRLKDPIDPMENHSIIYQIPCLHCLAVYIGMTIQTLRKRLEGHQSNIKRLDVVTKSTNFVDLQRAAAKTALTKHSHTTGHRFDLQNARAVGHNKNPCKLPILEMLEIKSHPHSINLKTDTNDLNKSYIAIVDQFRKLAIKRSPILPAQQRNE